MVVLTLYTNTVSDHIQWLLNIIRLLDFIDNQDYCCCCCCAAAASAVAAAAASAAAAAAKIKHNIRNNNAKMGVHITITLSVILNTGDKLYACSA